MGTIEGTWRASLRYADDRIAAWRVGSSQGQSGVLSLLIAATVLIFFASVAWYNLFPAVSFLVPIVVGGLLLRWKPLTTLTAVALIGAIAAALMESGRSGFATGRIATVAIIILVALLQLYMARSNRSELPAPLGQHMLAELRDRLLAQGHVPQLPAGWRAEQQIRSAGGTSYAGDFVVADLSPDGRRLELILVDLWGKGVEAGTKSLQVAGALGGLIGSLPPLGLVAAANDYLLRQRWNDGFATAAHVIIDLTTGRYSIVNAGHPPALRWCSRTNLWRVDEATGMALGVTSRPEFSPSEGKLEPGEALMLYTDGVVETRDRDIAGGISWLQGAARDAIRQGFQGAAGRVLDQVPTRDDDRALLLVERLGAR